MKIEITIKNIDEYDDISMAALVMKAGKKVRTMKCLWRTVRMKGGTRDHRMPRGTFPIKPMPRAGYLIALVFKPTLNTQLGLIPYKPITWENFGNDVYILNKDESTLNEDEYKKLVRQLMNNGADKLTIAEKENDTVHEGESFYINDEEDWEGWK